MIASDAKAFLALWNSIADSRLQSEYETWHAVEHVPERVGLPGFVTASRYVEAIEPGQTPRYFTLYALQNLGTLSTPEYQDVLDHPTPWSARMRGVLTDFCREPCDNISSAGTSQGGWLLALQLRVVRSEDEANIGAQLRALVGQGQALRVHLGRVDTRNTHPMDNARVRGSVQAHRIDLVALIEHFGEAAIRSCAVKLTDSLAAIAKQRSAPGLYRLQSAVSRTDLNLSAGTRPAPRTDLQQLFHSGDIL